MLDIQNLSKTFNPGTVNEKKALSSLSLHLDEGDFVTIVGSNGAGKSTLFNAIAGSFYADEGSISLAGKDITFMPEHERSRRIGRLFQDPLRGTAPHMTIEENLALAYLRAAHGNPFSRITAKDLSLIHILWAVLRSMRSMAQRSTVYRLTHGGRIGAKKVSIIIFLILTVRVKKQLPLRRSC